MWTDKNFAHSASITAKPFAQKLLLLSAKSFVYISNILILKYLQINHKIKLTKLALLFFSKVVFNHRLTTMTHCILMRSNSINFLTLYSIIFLTFFFIKSLFWRLHGVQYTHYKSVIISTIYSILIFVCQRHTISVTLDKRN